jgi:hypothetical protein
MAIWFWCSHENEGWVNFGGVGERDDFCFSGNSMGVASANKV